MSHRDKVQKLFGRRAQNYDNYTAWRDEERVLDEILRPLTGLTQQSWCLDLGGGTGRLARHGSLVSGRWVVADVSLEMLRAKPAQFARLNADATALPFKGESFDYIAAWSSLSYTDLRKALNEIHRITRRDGKVVIAEKVVGGYTQRASEWYEAIQQVRNPLKIQTLATSSIAASLLSCGFEVESTIELSSLYSNDYDAWLSRGGVLPEHDQQKLRALVDARPAEVDRLGFSVRNGIITAPVSWAVCTARKVDAKPVRPLIVTVAPVRRGRDGLEVYVQERRANLGAEPDYFGSFEFPQGHVEYNESMLEAARRELAEESGLAIVRMLDGDQATERVKHGLVDIEQARPSLVVVTSGRLSHVACFFIAEASEGQTSPREGNRGGWRSTTEFCAITRSANIYPLNRPMFELVAASLGRIADLIS